MTGRFPVFLSFSGDRSREVALFLREWIPDILQAVDPWTSAKDIETGARWGAEIGAQLGERHIGIICVTPENVAPEVKPWLAFEAGALSKAVDVSRVTCLCCFGVGFASVPDPLRGFQNTAASDKTSVYRLLEMVNERLGEMSLEPDRLRRTFDDQWLKYTERMSEIERLGGEHEEVPAPTAAEMFERIELKLAQLSNDLKAQPRTVHSARDVELRRRRDEALVHRSQFNAIKRLHAMGLIKTEKGSIDGDLEALEIGLINLTEFIQEITGMRYAVPEDVAERVDLGRPDTERLFDVDFAEAPSQE